MIKEFVLIFFIKPDGCKTLNKMKSKLPVTKIFLNTHKVRFYFQNAFFSNVSAAKSIRHIKKLKLVN